jgi:hypothetical protein
MILNCLITSNSFQERFQHLNHSTACQQRQRFTRCACQSGIIVQKPSLRSSRGVRDVHCGRPRSVHPCPMGSTSVRIAIVIGIARIRSADAPAHTLSLAIRSKAEPLSRQCMSGLNSLVRGRRGSEDVVEELLRFQLRLPLAMPLHIVCVARTRAEPDLDTDPLRLAKQTIVHADKSVINHTLIAH